MRNLSQIVNDVCARPGMYSCAGTFQELAALVTGIDLACEGAVLEGFREWLIVRSDGPANLAWPALVLSIGLPEKREAGLSDLSAAEEAAAIATMRELLAEFMETRATSGLRRVYLEYEMWLRKQDWYGPGYPDWFDLDVPSSGGRD